MNGTGYFAGGSLDQAPIFHSQIGVMLLAHFA
jgi:hypothetical protein